MVLQAVHASITHVRSQGGERFTAHDLRSYYVSEKKDRGEDPQTHANEATTARVYDRRKVRTIKPLA
jgi:integrase